MSSILLINSDIQDLDIFISCIKSEHKYLVYKENETKIEDVLNLFDDNTKYLTFVYHFPGYYEVPFFINRTPNRKYRNFSNELIELFKKSKEKTSELTIDFLSCNINDKLFSSEVNKIENELGVNIRYSVNATGNKNGDWILESDNSNIKNFYFNDNIKNWNYILTGEITTTELVNAYSAFFKKEGFVTTLLKNANSTEIGITNTNCFIILDQYEIFDGGNFTITYDASIPNRGLIATKNVQFKEASPLIRNLTVISSGNIPDGGGIVRNDQRFFSVENCISSGTISGANAGGICGLNAGRDDADNNPGYVSITNCSSTGIIAGPDAGGIAGTFGGLSGNLIINKCFSTGNITGIRAGGIVGSYFANTGFGSIEGCYSTGIIQGSDAGGIAGNNCGYLGTSSIAKCYSLGNIIGPQAGGIGGSYSGASATLLDISGCYSNGSISGSDSGGIVGQYGGNNTKTPTINGILRINNCYSNGNYSGTNSGGICGSFVANNGTCTLNNCYTTGLKIGVSAGSLLGIKASSGGGVTNINNCYTNNAAFKLNEDGTVNETNSLINLSLITNKIDNTTTWNTTTIWRAPSSNVLDLNRFPRLRGFADPTSDYYDFKYMTFNRQPDYRLTGAILYIDPTYYIGASASQILDIRSNVLDDIFTKTTRDRVSTRKENLGFDQQPNASSYSKPNYLVLKSGNTPGTRYNIDRLINKNTGVYLNLSQVNSTCLVTINKINQTITRRNVTTYNFSK